MTRNRTTEAELAYADRVLHEVQITAASGLDPDRVAAIATNTLAGLEKASVALAQADYTAEITKEVTCPGCKTKHVVRMPQAPEVVARAMAHAAKASDTLVRLAEFVSGRPDSRPDKAGAWLRALTNEQLATVSGWIEANEQREAAGPEGGR